MRLGGRAGTSQRHCSTRVYQYQVLGLAYGPQECADATGGDRLSKSGPAFLGPVCQSRYQVLVYPRTAVALGCARASWRSEGPARAGPSLTLRTTTGEPHAS